VINEGETSELQVEGLTAGTYYFQCDVHPEMNGSIVVEG
jgi:plastocyanin